MESAGKSGCKTSFKRGRASGMELCILPYFAFLEESRQVEATLGDITRRRSSRERRESVLVSAHTSAGKTVVAELRWWLSEHIRLIFVMFMLSQGTFRWLDQISVIFMLDSLCCVVCRETASMQWLSDECIRVVADWAGFAVVSFDCSSRICQLTAGCWVCLEALRGTKRH
eukprot:1161235-Pelagomonas_calceolata.AAC.2